MIRALWRRLARGERARRDRAATRDEGALAGDRGATFARRTRSLQSRMNSFFAFGLAGGIAAMALAWYYGAAAHSRSDVTPAQAVRSPLRVAGPPPLGPLPAPLGLAEPRASRPFADSAQAVRGVMKPRRADLLMRFQSTRPRSVSGRAGLPDQPAPRRRVTGRLLGGAVFIGTGLSAASGTPERVRWAARRPGGRLDASSTGDSALRQLLHPSVMSATRAHLLPEQRLLLAKGTFIDCTLETAIDSTLPGMTTCITGTDTFSADGTVVLLPRGTQLIGQTRGRVRQGMARVFVIWTEARTPSGVVVRLDSPSTDALGRSGLGGKVNRHFWERFGAALLVSTLTGIVQSRVESASGTVIVDPTAGEEVLAQTLRANEDIAPTITVPNGQRIEVLVARDIDFRPVYALVAR